MLKEELRRKPLRDKIDDLSEDQAHFVLLSVFYSGDKSRYISEDQTAMRVNARKNF